MSGDVSLTRLPVSKTIILHKTVRLVCANFNLGKKLSIKQTTDLKNWINNLNKKFTHKEILENSIVNKKNTNTISAEIILNRKYIGLDNKFKKIFEKIRPNCLTKIKNLFKSQLILHFTFDYLFFFLIK